MKILAFDTSSSACSVALLNEGKVKSLHKVAPMQQANLILPMIQSLLDDHSLTLSNLDAIAFGGGPGSFTGIRIASSVAQGIGFATQLPLIRISSLAAAAQAAYMEHNWKSLLVAVDARMEQIYWAIYQANSKKGIVELIEKEEIFIPDDVTVPAENTWYGIGDGWQPYEKTLIKRLGFTPLHIHPSQLPTAEAILKLAVAKFEQGETLSPSDAIPVYLR